MPRGPHSTLLPKRRGKPLEPEWRQALRTNLRNRRIAQGIKQRELGDQVGVIQQYIQQLESPKTPDVVPSLFLLNDLAVALKTTMPALLTPGTFGAEIAADEDLRAHRGRVT